MRRRFRSTLGAAVCAALLLAGFGAPQTGRAAPNSVSTPDGARVIVKLKAGSSLLLQAPGQARAAERVRSLSVKAGISMQPGISIRDDTQVVIASGLSAEELVQRLSQIPDVDYAVEDTRRFKNTAPNDTYYPAGQTGAYPPSGQWYLRAPTSDIISSINAEAGWDITTGSGSVVVAVLDSGIRKDHEDLGANLLDGYDMITNVSTANDGDGRDADPSDPGDWVTQTEATTPSGPFAGCTVENSSWHGTQTAGLIGATTNNAIGIASVGRNVKVLPVRVLGKCGGYDSDIVAAMRWAVGLQVGSLPLNPHPAKIINLSLGSAGTCSSAYISAIADVKATGAIVVAAAGNSAGHSVSTPANCPGVVAVGGLRHVGTKVGYSDVGPEIALSAPAGNCVTNTGICQYPIITTSNSGTTTPVSGGSIYTDGGNDASLGTSFSAPMVSAAAALIWSARPSLTGDEVTALLKSGSRPFPTSVPSGDTTIAACHVSNGKDQLECYCTTGTCGAGMLDVGASVSLAVDAPFARIASSPSQAIAGQAVTLDASQSIVASGRSIVGYTWAVTNSTSTQVVSGIDGATSNSTASVTPLAAGTFAVTLTIADSAGSTSSVTKSITVIGAGGTTTVASASSGSDGGGGGSVSSTWLVLLAAAIAAMMAAGHADRRRGGLGRGPN